MYALSIPLFILKNILQNKKSIRDDANLCIKYIENNLVEIQEIPDYNYEILVIAEDHRNSLHYGVDPIAIARCFYLKHLKKTRQGGSTIEQQYVRTITKRYERTAKRKLREQIISMIIYSKIKNKKIIGLAYLHCAYFGYDQHGFFSVNIHERSNTLELISRLKYPTKKNQLARDNMKTSMRVEHIKHLVSKKRFLPVVRGAANS